MRKKFLLRIDHLKQIILFFIGFSLGIISIWPGIISGESRNCFFNIIKDGSDGDIHLKTIVSVNPNYLLRIKSTNNIYLKVLFIGDSCFRKF